MGPTHSLHTKASQLTPAEYDALPQLSPPALEVRSDSAAVPQVLKSR
jgi:hypothetical protein